VPVSDGRASQPSPGFSKRLRRRNLGQCRPVVDGAPRCTMFSPGPRVARTRRRNLISLLPDMPSVPTRISGVGLARRPCFQRAAVPDRVARTREGRIAPGEPGNLGPALLLLGRADVSAGSATGRRGGLWGGRSLLTREARPAGGPVCLWKFQAAWTKPGAKVRFASHLGMSDFHEETLPHRKYLRDPAPPGRRTQMSSPDLASVPAGCAIMRRTSFGP